MDKRWVIRESDAGAVHILQEALGIHPVLCKLLVDRGIDTYDKAKQFFRPQLSDLHNPFEMKGMREAVNRILRASEQGERILVYGDYDVDGTTSVALMFSFLNRFYPNIDYYIPDRYKEGYGISFQGIDYAEDNNCALIIALDCGIKAVEQVAYANSKGIDMIICDHHLPGDELPAAVAILDPHQPDCNYPYKYLSGCGIGFKLAQAITLEAGLDEDRALDLLDLVAVSIASDIVPITGENRVLAFYGLRKMDTNPTKGLKALMEISDVRPPLSISKIVFGLGPRINAAGRLDDARKAVRMLISSTDQFARNHAGDLQGHNMDRKEIDRSITAEALEMLDNDPLTPERVTNVLFNPAWHKGVIGIVASRIMDHYYKPTIMLTESNGVVAGSARSVKGYDVYEAISACGDLLEQFGGHMYAAGLTMKPENVEAFKDRFEKVVKSTIRPEQLIPEIEIDAVLNLKDITPGFYKILRQFAPFGPENLPPVFITEELTCNGRSKVVGNGHLKLDVRDRNRFRASGIAFQQGDHYPYVSSGYPFDLAYYLEENEFNGQTNLQLNVKDIRVHA
ncbi:MAG: single-stranded-DNA-specific exonuclease RecJ [Chitinophagales bacterium]|nr:single-stranded-DNA-specific exonuclease RecJ [Chitinophagales bacterium]MCB9019652.1 single-stranded-DNA-specific exonuclease RecJ [Chitinophagales bacterium]MCB9021124.1 single-stranded-DNA-specific exonuclease RecJ [Chitinophagales bacterium]HPE96499.1 single-stranded-DNA-specific exonuclease RecJ [Chitinophagales bacterium]HQU38283.1 single-stranded-DNA-specific exonuclease RecJ [Chitinophagales bacterium]